MYSDLLMKIYFLIPTLLSVKLKVYIYLKVYYFIMKIFILRKLVCLAAGGIVDYDIEDQYINVQIKLLKSD